MTANHYPMANTSANENQLGRAESHASSAEIHRYMDGQRLFSNNNLTNSTSTPNQLDQIDDINGLLDLLKSEHEDIIRAADAFFVYFTPVIIVVGIFGNSLSVAVFCSKSMRKLSASTYLAALAVADICTLLFYVFVEWLKRGNGFFWDMGTFEFLHRDGVCQVLVYLAYVSRLMSAWIVVMFTMERFAGVCYPLKSFRKGAKKILSVVLIASFILSLYKPIMLREHRYGTIIKCGVDSSIDFVSFVLDIIFVVFLTLIPFLIITALNILIVRKLFIRNMRSSEDSQIRLEFTMILFAISFFFVAFNAPYFIVWSKVFFIWSFKFGSPLNDYSVSDFEYWQAVLSIVKTVFYLNYCINFFLYSITGAYFRRELFDLLTFRSYRNYRHRDRRSYIRCSRFGSSRTHMTSTNNSVCATSTA